jgi:hypothetical protein
MSVTLIYSYKIQGLRRKEAAVHLHDLAKKEFLSDLVIDGEVWVEVEYLGGHEQEVAQVLHLPVRDNQKQES